jgi:hypothetical protein
MPVLKGLHQWKWLRFCFVVAMGTAFSQPELNGCSFLHCTKCTDARKDAAQR